MNQKQAVATLYLVAGVLGLCAVMIVTTGYVKMILSAAALAGVAYTAARIARYPHDHSKPPARQKEEKTAESRSEISPDSPEEKET